MNILITNDDGIYSPGLAAAADALGDFGDLFIAAPSTQKTGSGRSLIGHRDQHLERTELEIDGTEIPAYHMDCTPALVVKHAFNTVFRNISFDIAVSGINYGENIGYDITMSGTVGGAVECAVAGIPAFAVSLQTQIDHHLHYGDVDWKAAKHYLQVFVRRCIDVGGFTGFDICKIDVPEAATADTGWVLSKLSRQSYFSTLLSDAKDDSKLSEVDIGWVENEYEKGSDAYAINTARKIAVTPLSLDWTARETGEFFSL